MKNITSLVEGFFGNRLITQLKVSPNTIASYRDTFKILFMYIKTTKGKNPSDIKLEDIDSKLVGNFLNYLEKERGNSARTRNSRLAAIHSFFKYVSFEEPQLSDQIQRVLKIPIKRFEKREVTYLNNQEIKSLLSAPNRDTQIGRRDYLLLLIGIQTGLRVSELIGLKIEQIKLGKGAHIRCFSKGRKERCSPLTANAQKIIKEWFKERQGGPADLVFISQRGEGLSRDAVEKRLKKYSKIASKDSPTLMEKNITPHVLRHTTAMQLLKAGVDITIIALYLGHESIETTHIYLKADLEMKEEALKKVNSVEGSFIKFKPSDRLLSYLEGL